MTDDDRVTCATCRHYRPGRCTQHKAAGMPQEIGRDLAELLQRCPAHVPRPQSKGGEQ